MLAVVAADGARLDPGSVGLRVARRWGQAGESVLFVDADTAGTRLAQRLGAAEGADYSPAARGLPSLVVAREALTLKSVAAHCYSLDDTALWALFAPFHPAGGQLAASWLAGRAGELRTLDRQRRVVLTSSIQPSATALAPLLRAAAVLVVLAPLESLEQAKGLWMLCRDAGLMDFGRKSRVLIVEGESPLDDDEIRVEAGMHIAGRLPLTEDDRVLRVQGGRRERAFASEIDSISDRLLALSDIGEGDGEGPSETAPAGDRAPAAGQEPSASLDGSGLSDVNGSHPQPDEASEGSEARSEGRV